MESIRSRWLLGATLALAAAAFSACGGDEVRPGTPITPPKDFGTASKGSDTPGSAAAQPSTLFIANTGGTGVALRNRCEDAARAGGTGLKDGTEARVMTVGADQCGGWTLIDAAGTTSWVRNEYLSTERPAAVAVQPRPAGGATSGGGGAPPPPAQTGRFVKALQYGEHWIPLDQLEYRSAGFGPILMTPTGPRPGSYVCPVYNYSAPTVRTATGVILQDPDPMGCGFARADTAVIRDTLVFQ